MGLKLEQASQQMPIHWNLEEFRISTVSSLTLEALFRATDSGRLIALKMSNGLPLADTLVFKLKLGPVSTMLVGVSSAIIRARMPTAPAQPLLSTNYSSSVL